jgi:hypothetical protein
MDPIARTVKLWRAALGAASALVKQENRMGEENSGAEIQIWAQLNRHFEYRTTVMRRFKHADRSAIVRMWDAGVNEFGAPLSAFEREALVERHCELFGCWPT